MAIAAEELGISSQNWQNVNDPQGKETGTSSDLGKNMGLSNDFGYPSTSKDKSE